MKPKLNAEQVAEIKQKMMNGGTSKDAEQFAQRFGVAMTTIYSIKAGDSWRGIGFTPTEDRYKFTPQSWHFKRLRFWDRVEMQTERQPNGCHIFTGSKDENGYGRISNGTKLVRVHREVYQKHHGQLQRHQFVCHKCDTPACINIEHLFCGTHADNMADKAAKGRNRSGWRKLNQEKIEAICAALKEGVSGAALARIYGVSSACISHVKHKKRLSQRQ